MGLLAVEGFDHQNTSTDLISNVGAFCWRQVNQVSFNTPGRFGGKDISYNGNTGYLTGTLTTPITEAIFGVAVLIAPYNSGIGNTGIYDISVYDSSTQNPATGTNLQVQIHLDTANGTIKVYRGASQSGGVLLGTSGNNSFPTNSWFYLEVDVLISATVGKVTVYINGVAILAMTGINTRSGANTILDSIIIGKIVNETNNFGSLIDDFYICDKTSGAGPHPFNTPIGPVRIYTSFPVAAASTQWTPLASTNVSQVQETAMDSDTTYNSDSTVGHEDTFTIGAIPAGLLPIAVQTTGAYRQDSGSTRAVANHLVSGATDTGGASQTCNGTYTYQRDVFPQDPNGSIAWTRANVNACDIGYKVTV